MIGEESPLRGRFAEEEENEGLEPIGGPLGGNESHFDDGAAPF